MPIASGVVRKMNFLRQYGPMARNENMYDEDMLRYTQKHGIIPLRFTHPWEQMVLGSFQDKLPRSVILTGDAGDGKSHLCGKIWTSLGGSPADWTNDHGEYLSLPLPAIDGQPRRLHVIRDLTAWVPDDGNWPADQAKLLQHFCETLLTDDKHSDLFLIAVNDGQLGEAWRSLPRSAEVELVEGGFERLLYQDQKIDDGLRLSFHNLSRVASVDLFRAALEAFLSYDSWEECLQSQCEESEAFGLQCPIRRNYELLRTPLVQQRLFDLFALCDANDLHVSIRQVLLLLINAVFGHRTVDDRLMRLQDVPRILAERSSDRASLYANIFGANLSEHLRKKYKIFQYFDRFRIGSETSPFADNLLIFGQSDAGLRADFDTLLGSDPYYLATPAFLAAQQDYFEGKENDKAPRTAFVEQMQRVRRGLFFRIPPAREQECQLWQLTVFTHAGEYLHEVADPLRVNKRVKQSIRQRLVRGLNRIFTGMLIATDTELVLATSLSSTTGRVSRLWEDSISVEAHHGESIDLALSAKGVPQLVVKLSKDISRVLTLYLTRYEFLSRVAAGALPSSFSKECYEDILAFKSQVLVALAKRRHDDGETSMSIIHQLRLNEHGHPALPNDIHLPEEIDHA